MAGETYSINIYDWITNTVILIENWTSAEPEQNMLAVLDIWWSLWHVPTHPWKVFSHWSYSTSRTPIAQDTTVQQVAYASWNRIYAEFEDAADYVINVYDWDVTIWQFTTYNSSELLSLYLNQVNVPSHAWYVFKWWQYWNWVEVDPSDTIWQASSEVQSNTINIYTHYISIKSITSIIWNWTEFGFTVDWDTLARVATTGEYSDLNNTPEIPVVNDATISFTEWGISKWSFSLNQSTNKNIELFPVGTFFESFENAVYDSFWRLRSFTADDVDYTLTYEWGKLKTISNGTDTYVATYSGNLLQTVYKLVI